MLAKCTMADPGMSLLGTLSMIGVSVFMSATISGRDSPPNQTPEQNESVPAQSTIEDWINNLGHEEPNKRKVAHSRLLQAGAKAKVALESSMRSAEPEAKSRISILLRRIYFAEGNSAADIWLQDYVLPILGAKTLRLTEGAEKSSGHVLGGSVEYKPRYEFTESSRWFGLLWLVKAQESDGHWKSKKFGSDISADLVQTNLALLALLAGGHTSKVGEFKEPVIKAMAWIMKQQHKDGSFRNRTTVQVDGIAHALTTITMFMAAGMANEENYLRSAQSALDFGCKTFQKKQGENLGFILRTESPEPNLLTSAMFAIALTSAAVCRGNVSQTSLDVINQFGRSVQNKKLRAFSFVPTQPPSTIATFAGILLGKHSRWKAKQLDKYIETASLSFGDLSPDERDFDLLRNFLGSLALVQEGDTRWANWDNRMGSSLAETQRKDGLAKGSWDPKGKWIGVGRVATTAVNVLCLETDFQYLPLFRP